MWGGGTQGGGNQMAALDYDLQWGSAKCFGKASCCCSELSHLSLTTACCATLCSGQEAGATEAGNSSPLPLNCSTFKGPSWHCQKGKEFKSGSDSHKNQKGMQNTWRVMAQGWRVFGARSTRGYLSPQSVTPQSWLCHQAQSMPRGEGEGVSYIAYILTTSQEGSQRLSIQAGPSPWSKVRILE